MRFVLLVCAACLASCAGEVAHSLEPGLAAPAEGQVAVPPGVAPENPEPRARQLVRLPNDTFRRSVSTNTPTVITQRNLPANETRLSRINWISFEVSLGAVAAPRELQAEFLTPKGSMYEVRKMTVRPGERAVGFLLPVAGTTMDQSGLSGQWTLPAFLDGALAAELSFEVLP